MSNEPVMTKLYFTRHSSDTPPPPLFFLNGGGVNPNYLPRRVGDLKN